MSNHPVCTRIVTIDGPAGVGKTTLAQRVAHNIHVPYLDTGAMFRCLALKLSADTPHLTLLAQLPEAELHARCDIWSFSLQGSGAHTRLLCNNIPVGAEIRTEDVGMLASQLATVPLVRRILKHAQQTLGTASPLVVEGRDMGTEIFPQARHKFFLDARPEVRALRRLHDLRVLGEHPDLTQLTDQIRQRDAQDRGRAIAPLRPAPDAIILDTSDDTVDTVLGHILQHIHANGGL